MKGALIALGVIVLLAVILGGSLMGSRNELVTERESINGAFAQVDTALQRRNDLIPNLVETVKGMGKQEQNVIDSVTKARAAMLGAQTPANKIQADADLRSAIGRLMVAVENYPHIKSNENFFRFHHDLARTQHPIPDAPPN